MGLPPQRMDGMIFSNQRERVVNLFSLLLTHEDISPRSFLKHLPGYHLGSWFTHNFIFACFFASELYPFPRAFRFFVSSLQGLVRLTKGLLARIGSVRFSFCEEKK